jgi:hypothetical protein
MSKNYTIIAVIAIILVIGAVLLIGVQNKSSVSDAQRPRTVLANGGSELCTFKDTSGQAVINGAIHIGNHVLRSDFTSTSGGTQSNIHVVMTDQFTYSWINGQLTGIKAPRTATSTIANQNLDIDRTAMLTCGTWPVDESMFNLPTNVSFVTVNQ